MPKATVAAVITRQNLNKTQILLMLRAIEPFRGQWCFPGGHIDDNEPAIDAVVREIKEEVGLQFKAKFFDYFDEIILPCFHAVVLVFDGAISGEVSSDPNEVTEARWFFVEQALKLPLAFQHNEILKSYIEQDSRCEGG